MVMDTIVLNSVVWSYTVVLLDLCAQLTHLICLTQRVLIIAFNLGFNMVDKQYI